MENSIPQNIHLCAVTKQRSIEETEKLLERIPQIKIIAENRWPDCEEKFHYFAEKQPNLERHFIGPLQTNKVRKVVSLVDAIQSVDSQKLLNKINAVAGEQNKNIDVLFQVNISEDNKKHGLTIQETIELIRHYKAEQYENVTLKGLMTIGHQGTTQERTEYFTKLKQLFDEINTEFFSQAPLQILSMGMSKDYEIAIKAGATMVRLGTCLY